MPGHHPTQRLLRRWARPATSWPTPSSSRSTTRRTDGTNVESHYTGTGGVQLSSIFTRAAFALRLGDFNLLISSQITDKSRIMFIRDPVSMAQKAAPFLTFDHDPYAVINSARAGSRAHRLDRRRLHDDGQLRLLAERRHPAGGGRQQPARELQLRAQLGEGRHRRLLGEDDLLRRRPEGPDSAGVLGRLPEHVLADFEDAGLAAGAPALPAGHLLHSVRHLRALPPDQLGAVLRRQQRLAAVADRRRRAAVAGAAGPEHLQQPGSAGLDHSGPHGAAVPGVLAAGHRAGPSRSSRSRTASSRRRRRTSRAPTRTST